MKSKPIKSTEAKTTASPETVISIKQEIIDFEIQINNLKNKKLESQRKLLTLGRKNSFFTDCDSKDFPDE